MRNLIVIIAFLLLGWQPLIIGFIYSFIKMSFNDGVELFNRLDEHMKEKE